ncbi:hypothetical protein D7B24_002865 [Verticillium nonalfalfae]|uniref:Uncharacterized protein n=3 Tax=Verticillium TaxID=1036719 RepID=A0A2J8EJ04_VERDA|nr:uncharacterized protein D7B24_002865 [Verticillium nonalfalfae]KAG7103353.1 hypothetical protein HYQ44_017441 [Verticillium longisporum]PNH33602.1 hypothetical protein BJF96_g3128 [Verticillium dahliae]KAG7122893.1 hypothetical protein HYQ44_003791 [Verticillium longisporum]PNH39647.1 hypothetical protein VD0004_g7259 [Verticillium dahliae]PNH54769.1 hypothetical protein VD0003_g2789 [Verticillium dahliae]
MCDWIQREFHCGHFRWIVSRWCPEYLRTQLRCPLSVSHYEYRGDEQCSHCKPRQTQPWEKMIRRNNQTIGL